LIINSKEIIKKELLNFKKSFDKEIIEFLNNKKPQTILKWIKYYIEIGGKRVRPFLAYKIIKKYDDPKKYKELLFSLEIYHNSILIIDDIQDNDETRRGKKSLWKIIGKDQAINIGFYGLLFAIEIIKNMKLEEEQKRRILEFFDKVTKKTVEGQYIDIFLSKNWKKLTKKKLLRLYIRNNLLKTAYYLFLPIAVAYLLFNEKIDKNLFKEGLYLGFLFQLMNDLEDLVEKKSDLKRRLPTLPFILIMNKKNKKIFEKNPDELIKEVKKEKVIKKIEDLVKNIEKKLKSDVSKELYLLIKDKIEKYLNSL
jgi:geranylgeranyl diphosphate synthase type II